MVEVEQFAHMTLMVWKEDLPKVTFLRRSMKITIQFGSSNHGTGPGLDWIIMNGSGFDEGEAGQNSVPR